MRMKESLPFVGMVAVQFVVVGQIVAVKEVTASGMTKFTFVCYSNAIASLVLLPTAFLVHRSNRPPLNFSLLCKFFLLSVFVCTAQVTGNVGVEITPAAFSSSLINLVPAFTFILAVIFRMEDVDFRRSSTLAKTIGTIVSIIGAITVTLYKGPSILKNPSQSNLLLGGLLLTIDCLACGATIITQGLILKKYCRAELVIVFFYTFFVAILCAILSFVMEKDLDAWSLRPPVRLVAVLYSGIVNSAVICSIFLWCLDKRGPIFVSVFGPLGIVISAAVGIIFLGDILYLGSLVGSIIIVIGFYTVIWGKGKEREKIEAKGASSFESTEKQAPLLSSIGETQV
ncbi:hypothetical protein NMG60_11008984 [Bertholletia excelsa]